MIKKWCRYWWLMLISLSGCTHQQDYQIKQSKQTHAEAPVELPVQKTNTERHEPTLTVWVHGTRASKAVFQNFFKSVPGLQSCDVYNKSNNQYTIAHALNDANPQEYPFDRLLLFGWSGKLSHTARQKAAHDLHAGLVSALDSYEQQHGIRPHLRIITHSHGGNVALLMHESTDQQKKRLVIDELIMLACPVQRATVNYMSDPMFKNIIAIFSPSDLVQVVDPQGLYEVKDAVVNGKALPQDRRSLFSHRRFPAQDNLVQLKVRRHGHGLSHITFILRPFLMALPCLLEYIKEQQKTGSAFQQFEHNGFVFKSPKQAS